MDRLNCRSDSPLRSILLSFFLAWELPKGKEKKKKKKENAKKKENSAIKEDGGLAAVLFALLVHDDACTTYSMD